MRYKKEKLITKVQRGKMNSRSCKLPVVTIVARMGHGELI